MAYQTKSYRKFVATAATAALVASAVAPAASAASNFKDVSATYKDAVDYLVANEIAKGLSDTEFGVTKSITRGDAAVMIANALKLDTANAKDAGFKDLNARVKGAVNALVEAKIVNGKTDTTYAPDANITRQEMAKIIANAYDLAADGNAPFKDVNKNWLPFVSALYDNDVTKGKTDTTFAPTLDVTRGEFALFVHRAETLAPAVTSVSAINANTLTLTGTGLKALKAADITVEGNTVASVTSIDGKTATVTLGTKLGLDKEYKVTVGSGDAKKEFAVKFTYEIKSVEVATVQVDDDAANQKIAFNVNGVAADLDFLINVAGYQVEYQASKDVFAAPGNTVSTTGTLDASKFAINETFNVKVVLTKAGSVFQSEYKTVTVKNLNETPAIGSLKITNHRTDGVGANDFVQTSSTFVAGETATVTDILSTTEDEIVVTGGAIYASSNLGVATVSSTGVITAIAPGTFTLTVTAGLQTYTKTFTVTGEARKAGSVTPAKASYTLSNPTSTAGGYTVDVTAKDQFGDPISVVVASSSTIGTIADVTTSAVNGKGTITLPAQATNATYPVYLKVGGIQYGAFNVVVTNDSVVASTKIESSDNALDLSGDLDTVVTVNQYTTVGGFIESLDPATVTNATSVALTGAGGATYTLSVVDTTIADLTAVNGTPGITVKGLKTGSTKLVVKDSVGNIVPGAEFTVTVTDSKVTVTAITWKNPGTLTNVGKVVSPRDVLTITNVTGDDIVTGLTLSKTTTSKVRINEFTTAGSTAENTLYLDVNDSGDYEAGTDVLLGTLAVSVDPLFTANPAVPTTVAASTSAATWFNGTTGVLNRALAAGDKGSLIFTFTKDGASIPLTSNVVTIEVK